MVWAIIEHCNLKIDLPLQQMHEFMENRWMESCVKSSISFIYLENPASRSEEFLLRRNEETTQTTNGEFKWLSNEK